MKSRTLPQKQIPVAWAVMAIAVALVLVLVSAIGLSIWNSYRDALERTRLRVETSSQVVSTHVEWLIAASLRVLHDADKLAGGTPADISSADAAAFRSLLQFLPDGLNLLLVDTSGRIVLSTSPRTDKLAPEDSAAINRLENDNDWYVSPAEIEGKPEKQSFLIAKRLERGGKAVGGVALSIPVVTITNLWASLDLGPSSTVGLLRNDGWLVARYPMPDKPVNLSSYILFTDYLKKSSTGVYETVSPVDGTVRIVGYRTVRNGPLVITAAASRDFALAPLWKQIKELALLLIPLIIGLAALAVWVARLLHRDELMRVSLSAAVERNNLLMREIHHRIKNNLQSVASLVRLQPISNEAKAAMNARIAAMSAVHEQAYRSDLYAEVDLREYLTLLIDNIAKSASRDINIASKLQSMTIDRDLAQPLGLVVNEVISNAMKHAFAGRDKGQIDITLAMLSPDMAELVIRDDGAGFEPSDDDKGMGSRLIRAFAHQLGNDYGYANDNGTVFSIRFAAKVQQAS